MDWDEVKRKAEAALDAKEVVGLPLDAAYPAEWLERLFEAADVRSAPVLPVRVETRATAHGRGRRIFLLAGEPLKRGATPEDVQRAIQR